MASPTTLSRSIPDVQAGDPICGTQRDGGGRTVPWGRGELWFCCDGCYELFVAVMSYEPRRARRRVCRRTVA